MAARFLASSLVWGEITFALSVRPIISHTRGISELGPQLLRQGPRQFHARLKSQMILLAKDQEIPCLCGLLEAYKIS